MPKSAQGVKSDRYKVIPRTLVFITKGRDILLIKGAPEKRLWANLYNGIGGHVEKGEDVFTSARREILEETGIETGNLQLCGIVIVDVDEHTGISIHVFRSEYLSGELRNSREGTLEWINMNNINDYPLVEDLYTLIPKVLKYNAQTGPFSALYQYDQKDQLVISFG